MLESVVPVPVLPAASVTPVLASVMMLLVSEMLPAGVRVAVQVIPPSEELGVSTLPFATVRSPAVRPDTASLKVIVTVEVSPAARAVSATTIVAVGRRVSMA